LTVAKRINFLKKINFDFFLHYSNNTNYYYIVLLFVFYTLFAFWTFFTVPIYNSNPIGQWSLPKMSEYISADFILSFMEFETTK